MSRGHHMDQYGIMGSPIHHSLSPCVHKHFALQVQHTISYLPLLVEPDNFAKAVSCFEAQKGKGLNITAPFKTEAYQLVDHWTPRAAETKSVNTIRFNADGSRTGDNTDGEGLLKDLKNNQALQIQAKNILILGAGGAVRSVLTTLLNERPARIVVSNRTHAKALALTEEFAVGDTLQALEHSQLQPLTFDLVINGTSPSWDKKALIWPAFGLTPNACCYDMVYGKALTAFLEHSQSLGASVCVNGLGMLVEQAAESFYFWRGVRPNTKNVISSLSAL
jgi:shikimate dehydrogenase